jgi:hypothetical protein
MPKRLRNWKILPALSNLPCEVTRLSRGAAMVKPVSQQLLSLWWSHYIGCQQRSCNLAAIITSLKLQAEVLLRLPLVDVEANATSLSRFLKQNDPYSEILLAVCGNGVLCLRWTKLQTRAGRAFWILSGRFCITDRRCWTLSCAPTIFYWGGGVVADPEATYNLHLIVKVIL